MVLIGIGILLLSWLFTGYVRFYLPRGWEKSRLRGIPALVVGTEKWIFPIGILMAVLFIIAGLCHEGKVRGF